MKYIEYIVDTNYQNIEIPLDLIGNSHECIVFMYTEFGPCKIQTKSECIKIPFLKRSIDVDEFLIFLSKESNKKSQIMLMKNSNGDIVNIVSVITEKNNNG